MSTKPARVLVTYSTAAGSTAGIAERIAQVLRSAGCTVQCLPASAVPDVEDVDALVVGSAVHDMAWLAFGRGVAPGRRIGAIGIAVQ